MGTDFFDDDLVKSADGRAVETPEKDSTTLGHATCASGRMAEQRERLINQVADSTEEIERMRMRQEELEQEKSKIVEIARKQDEYARGKTEIIDNLSKSIILTEKDEVQANRMVELLSATRLRFKDMLTEIRGIKEETWNDDVFAEELNRSLALVEDCRMEYSKAIAKIDAESWHRGAEGKAQLLSLDGSMRASLSEKGFLFWVKIGLAMSLPVILILLALFVGYLFSLGRL